MADIKNKPTLSQRLYGDMNDTQKTLITAFCIGLTFLAIASLMNTLMLVFNWR